MSGTLRWQMSSDQGILKTPSPHRRVNIPSLTNILREPTINLPQEHEELAKIFTESEDAVLMDAVLLAPMIAMKTALAPWKPESLPFGIANRIATLAVDQIEARGMTWRHPLKTTRRRLTWLARHQRLSSSSSPYAGASLSSTILDLPSDIDTTTSGQPPMSPTRASSSRLIRSNSSPFIDQAFKRTKVSSNTFIAKKPMSPLSTRFNARIVPSPRKQPKRVHNDSELDNIVPTVPDEDVSTGYQTPKMVARTLFQDSLGTGKLLREDSDDSMMEKGSHIALADSPQWNGDHEKLGVHVLRLDLKLTSGNFVTNPASPASPLAFKSHDAQLRPLEDLSLKDGDVTAGQKHPYLATLANPGNNSVISTGIKNEKLSVAHSIRLMRDYMEEGEDDENMGAHAHNDEQVISDEYY